MYYQGKILPAKVRVHLPITGPVQKPPETGQHFEYEPVLVH